MDTERERERQTDRQTRREMDRVRETEGEELKREETARGNGCERQSEREEVGGRKGIERETIWRKRTRKTDKE